MFMQISLFGGIFWTHRSLKAYVLGKWSDISVLIIADLKSLSYIEFAIIWSTADIVLFVTLVGLFMLVLNQTELSN